MNEQTTAIRASFYRTARVRGHIFTHNGADDLPAGEIVGVRFCRMAYNAMYRRTEPVYTVTLQGGRVYGDLYENALTGFGL